MTHHLHTSIISTTPVIVAGVHAPARAFEPIKRSRVRLQRMRLARSLALGGIVGPWLWTIVVVLLTVFEYDTLRSFGWTPGQDHGVNYPSSLSLGPLGWVQMLNFAALGLCTLGLAAGLFQVVRPVLAARLGPAALAVAGLGLLLSVFPTDHGPADAPTTWNGVLHVIGFGLAFGSLFLALFLLTASFRGDPRWRGYATLCPAIGVVALTGFIMGSVLLPESLNQVSFYLPLLATFVGLTLVGLRLRRVATPA
jgi:hypothetical protein